MPLMEHLRELRNRLVKSILVIILGMTIALVFSNQTLNIVARRLQRGDRRHERMP